MSRIEWSKDQTANLIAKYKETSILWDTTNIQHKNRELKNRAWKELAVNFNCVVEEVQRKIHNLRNQLCQELNKTRIRRSRGATDDSCVSKWPFFTVLEFLIPALTANCRRSSKTLSKEIVDVADTPSEEQVSHDDVDKQGIDKEESPKKQKRKTISQRQKRKKKDIEDDPLLKRTPPTVPEASDADDRFIQYVAMELKGLRSDFYKRKLKSEIRHAVARIVDEEDVALAAPASSSPPRIVIQSIGASSGTPTPLPSPNGETTSSSYCLEYIKIE
ncbi:uncharacterized protein LOC135130311 [Zophobas morio]|uniref:uncharacterized protein LOC135130311 n=1 Tax=Zophobas morio TaxID=2755281 RepID=UPI0030836935